MKPLLAHVYEPHRVTYPCYVQPKLNGIRALYQGGRFQSRDEIPFPEGLLDHLAKPLLQTFDPSVILDGELYVHGWPLQKINGAVTPVRQKPTEDTLKVEYHVFDVIEFGRSFGTRFRKYCPSVNLAAKDIGPIKWVQWDMPSDEQDADSCYARFVSAGYEGMMYRLGDCPYTVPKQEGLGYSLHAAPRKSRFLSDKNNRCWHLLKRKDWQDDEFDFVSIEPTIGEKGEPGFQLWCLARNGKRFKFGSGPSQAEVEFYLANPPIGKKVKGKYLVLSADGIPLNGTILAIL